MNPYVPLLVMIAAAGGLAVGGLVISAILGPKRRNRVKLENYECGVEATPSSGGMFNNYAIVQGCDHVVPVDIYLPGCPPRPEMLINAILELREQVKRGHKLTKRARLAASQAAEAAALEAPPLREMKGLLA